MIIPDVNLLVYAYNADAPHHEIARSWWQETLNGAEGVGLPWVVAMGFLRLATHPRVFVEPMAPEEAVAEVERWLTAPGVGIIDPGPKHLPLVRRLLAEAGTAGDLTTDVHLAAIAIELQATLASNDQDFGRFSGLRWVNPLCQPRAGVGS